jgi:hypothetical protein
MNIRPRSFMFALLLASCMLAQLIPGTPTVSWAASGQCDFDAIVKGVGEHNLKASKTADGQVVLIQEQHDIVAGQIEGAVMIHRLLRDCGYRLLGLEGAFPGSSFDTGWFNPGVAANISAGVSVNLLGKGEINQVEFAALVYPTIYADLKINGIDDETLYRKEFSTPESSDIDVAMLYVGLTQLSDANLQKALDMLDNPPDKNDKAALEKWRDALMKLIFTNSLDTSIRDWYSLSSATLGRCVEQSVETQIDTLDKALTLMRKYKDDVKAKLDVDISTDIAAAETWLEFYKTARDRSTTMVREIEKMLRANSGGKIAAVIGAGHTQWMDKQLKADGYNTAVLSPKSLCDRDTSTALSSEAYANKTKDPPQSVDPAGGLGALLAGGSHKPEVVLEQPWLQVETSVHTIAALASNAFKKDPKANLATIFQNVPLVPGVTVDTGSLELVKTLKGANAYVFGVEINVKGVPAKKIYVGINPSLNQPIGVTLSADIEKLLLDELNKVKTKPPIKLTEVAPNVQAFFSTDKDSVTKAIKNS